MHKNKKNGKVYIGITKAKPMKRWGAGNNYGKCVLFYNAIKKYGWDGFEHLILLDGLSKECAELKEIELIALHRSNHRDHGYNIQNGGNANCVSESTKEKLSISHKGMRNSIATEFKKGSVPYCAGKQMPDETKRKISVSKKGKKLNITDEYRAGKAGAKNPFFGKCHTDEAKQSMREKHLGQISQRRKEVLCVETGKTYNSLLQAIKETGIAHIGCVCTGNRKTAGGYRWEYIESEGI